MELIKPVARSTVSVDLVGTTYENLQANLRYDPDKRVYAGTGGVADPATASVNRRLQINVKLPAGLRVLSVDWIDTPGEIWSRNWARENPQPWQSVLTQVQSSEGVILILPPYRELLSLSPQQRDEFPTCQQWINRFIRWIALFTQDCPHVKHIIFCLNYADLFSDVNREAQSILQKSWHQRHDHVITRYFQPVKNPLIKLSYEHPAFVRCFLTSIYNRTLLELPWIYLASHFA
jgi:hypothetical protein